MNRENIDLRKKAAREKAEQETIAFHKERGEGGARYHFGRYLGILHLTCVGDAWKAEWSEDESDTADY